MRPSPPLALVALLAAAALAAPPEGPPYYDRQRGLEAPRPNEGRFVERERFLRHLVRLNRYQRVCVRTLQVTNDRAGAAFLRRLAEATGGRFHDVEALEAARAR